MAAAGLAGGTIALLAVAVIDPQLQLTHVDSIALAAGVLAGIGLNRRSRV